MENKPQSLEERIQAKAFEIWEGRMATGQYLIFEKGKLREITDKDDYFEARDEIIREEKKNWE